MAIGFDSQLYMKIQTQRILERVEQFGGKLYLEFGGKLFDDYHASRVLPGFDVNGKVKLLAEMKDRAEIILCINAGDIESNKTRSDIGLSYDLDVMRLIDKLRAMSLMVGSIVITQYTGQVAADSFRRKLEQHGEKVYIHKHTKGYPSDVNTIVSDEGYGANPYISTSRPIVVVTAPGPGSGKLATCLSQLYHEYRNGVKAGYAKYETFPVWDVPLQHPLNIAYEAATADLRDVNMIDPFHLEAYGKTAINYNRDIEVFPVVKTILAKIMGDSEIYRSPTDMGVNTIGRCIVDDQVVCNASKQEIVRRYFGAMCSYRQGKVELETAQRIELLMNGLELSPEYLKVVGPALDKAKLVGQPASALMLTDGRIITGKSSKLMTSSASVVLNAAKVLAGIADDIMVISPIVLEPICRLKQSVLGRRMPVLSVEEVLIALSISASMNPTAALVLKKLPALRGCQVHSSNIITQGDEDILRRLGLLLTCQPEFPTKDLYFR